jgi:hypothetical protein
MQFHYLIFQLSSSSCYDCNPLWGLFQYLSWLLIEIIQLGFVKYWSCFYIGVTVRG